MRHYLCVLSAAALLAAGFAAPSARAADSVVLELDWLPGGDKAPAYIGVAKGFFAAEGLDVTIQNGHGSSDAITKVATGTAQFATGGLGALMTAAAESAVPVRAIMSLYTKQPDAIFTVKGSPITALKDVAGHSIATATFSSSNTIWPVVLSANGIDPGSVKLLKVDPGTLAPMLASGQVDATINWVTVAPSTEAVLKQAGKQLAIIPWSDFGLDGYGLSVFAADKIIKEKPDAVARFVRAMIKSTDYCVAHPDEAGEAVHAAAPTLEASVAAAAFRASIPLIENDIAKKDGIGAFEPGLLRKTWVWVAKAQGYPEQKLDPESLVDRAFLPK
ncbi:MAG: ABC transporter substrate-binding protein [Stellaceae bacterium]